ncbi:uncharacterized protein [Amphiura filiformis]|uniref:uncharacterized protein n=1 Tax=Amphiura filiformis TaxID=82378 RepID=UPI003B2111C1
MTFQYLSTTDAGATSPADYQGLSGEALVFDANVKTRSYTLRINNDQETESSEDFFIYLSSDLGNDLGQRVELVTIEDDDNQIKFVATPGTDGTDTSVIVMESVGTARVTVQRSGYGSSIASGQTSVRVSSRIITVNDFEVDSANQTDFTSVNTILNFQPGQSRQDVLIAIADDEIGERKEVFELYLSDPTPSSNNAVIYPSTITVCIVDDDGGLPDIVDTPDGGGGTGNTGTNLDTAAIVGIGGGIGLLLLLGVLGLVGCVGMSRFASTRASGASLPLAAPPQRQLAPPAYYRTNPAGVQFGGRGPTRGAIRAVRY